MYHAYLIYIMATQDVYLYPQPTHTQPHKQMAD